MSKKLLDLDGLRYFYGKILARMGNLSNPNLLINGDFQIWQRGTSFDFSSINTGEVVYTADRWQTVKVNQIISKIPKGLKIKRTISSGYCGVGQYIEGNYKELIGKKLTLTFDFKSISGNLPYMYINAIVNGVDTNLAINFNLPSGKNSVTSIPIPEGIQENTLRVGLIGPSTAFEMDVYNAKLELGEIATPLSPRPYGEELALCQRYYRKIYGTVFPKIITNDKLSVIFDFSPLVQNMRENKTFLNLTPHNGMTLFNLNGFNSTSWGASYNVTQNVNEISISSNTLLNTPIESIGAICNLPVDAEIY